MMDATQEQQLRDSVSEIGDCWAARPFFQNGGFDRVISALRDAPRPIRPAPTRILRALRLQLQDVRVVILGNAPYPDNNLATGLAFAVPNGTPTHNLPVSLRNIFCELCLDVGCRSNHTTYDLEYWHTQGVMLLNTTLTVPRPSAPGWRVLVEDVINQLIPRDVFFVFLGRPAQNMIPNNLRGQNHRMIMTRHPSCPDSTSSQLHPFFGSKIFSHVNNFLRAHDIRIDW